MKRLLTYIFKHKPFRLYKYYNDVDQVFEEPILKWRFGKWTDSGLGPWDKSGPIINLYKYNQTYIPKTGVQIYEYHKGDILQDGTVVQYDRMKGTEHKIPGRKHRWQPVWRRDIRKKLKKWGLGWIPTQIHLPIWLSFDLINWSMHWKNKYDYYRYEWPPQFTIVFFGLSLDFWLVNPTGDSSKDSDYWESILYYRDLGDLKNVDQVMGNWVHNIHQPNQYEEPMLKEEFLKEPYKNFRNEKTSTSTNII